MLNYVVALRAEANPLIEQFNLKQASSDQYPVYRSDHATLIICGIGRNAAAAATAWLAATRPAKVWLNVGIAGHASKQQGTLFAAHRIVENGSGKCWYPTHIKTVVETENLMTFDNVQRKYVADHLHDMEASGFYETALRFSIAELTHSVKVVSDNSNQSVDKVDKKLIERLIGRNLSQIESFSSHLCEMAKEIQSMVPVELIRNYQQQWKFTVTQQHQLHRLLQRRQALNPEVEQIMPETLKTMSNSRSVLQWLKTDTDAMAEFY